MSHFTVMVIGNNPESQLKPFDEQIQVKKYASETVTDEDKNRFLKFYTEKDAANKGKSLEELYEQYGDDWNSNDWEKDKNGVLTEYSTYNPKSKWDWYQLGGRWSGLIKLKNGATGKKGEAGVGDNEVGIDQAKKGDIVNLDELTTFAILKKGQWYENESEFGNKKDEAKWNKEITALLADVSDDTLISIYDCHI